MNDKKQEPVASTVADKPFEAGIDTNKFRQKRFKLLLEHIENNSRAGDNIRLLDVGGTRAFWQGLEGLWSHLKLEITILNIGAKPVDASPYFIRSGNACDLSEYPDNSFDFVHSNSVIEHVGHWAEMKAMAKEVQRVAPHHFVQTPNFWFPVEPHYRTLFFQWYPEITRAKMLMRKKRGFRGPTKSLDLAMENIQTVNLLTRSQMRELFPDSRIVDEKFVGLTKSIMAIK